MPTSFLYNRDVRQLLHAAGGDLKTYLDGVFGALTANVQTAVCR